eukprot:1810368-Amphidinium_carterae.1
MATQLSRSSKTALLEKERLGWWYQEGMYRILASIEPGSDMVARMRASSKNHPICQTHPPSADSEENGYELPSACAQVALDEPSILGVEYRLLRALELQDGLESLCKRLFLQPLGAVCTLSHLWRSPPLCDLELHADPDYAEVRLGRLQLRFHE